MIITIEANLTNEEGLILAKQKGYSEMVQNITTKEQIVIVDGVETTEIIQVTEEIINPDSPFEFLKRVYEAMIISDATKHFLEVENNKLKEQQLIVEQAIKNNAIASITSSII